MATRRHLTVGIGLGAATAVAGMVLAAAPAAAAWITAERAVQIAQTVVPGSAVEVELEREEGRYVYEVLIGNQEVYVDAATGWVVDVEPAWGYDG